MIQAIFAFTVSILFFILGVLEVRKAESARDLSLVWVVRNEDGDIKSLNRGPKPMTKDIVGNEFPAHWKWERMPLSEAMKEM